MRCDMEEKMAQTDLHSDSAPVLTLVSLREEQAETQMLTRLLGAADPAPQVAVAPALEAALDGQGLVLAVVTQPERMLAHALGQGQVPSEAVAAWQVWAEARLALLRRARSRVVLLCADTLMATPEALTGPLGTRLGCAFSDIPKAGPAQKDPRAALHDILARHLLKSSPRLRALAEELGASIIGGDLPVAGDAEGLDRAFADLSRAPEPDAVPDDTSRHLRDSVIELQCQLSDETAARALVQATCDGLETRLAGVVHEATAREAALGGELLRLGREADARRSTAEAATSEADSLRADAHTLRAEVDSHQAQLTQAADSLAVLRGDLDDQRTRMRALELDLTAADETRRSQAALADDLHKTIEDQERSLAALQGELDQARSELDHIYRSKSWAIAGAIRSVRYGLRK